MMMTNRERKRKGSQCGEKSFPLLEYVLVIGLLFFMNVSGYLGYPDGNTMELLEDSKPSLLSSSTEEERSLFLMVTDLENMQ